MESVLPLVEDEVYLSTILSDHLKQIYSLTKVEHFKIVHYIYRTDEASDRCERYIHAINMRKAPLLLM